MNNPHAFRMTCECACKKRVEHPFGLRSSKAVQVDLAFNAICPATELAKHALGHARSAMRQRFSGYRQGIGLAASGAFLYGGKALGLGQTRPSGPPSRRRNDAVMAQRLDRSDGPAEQLDVFGAGLRFHATSGRGLSVYFPRLLQAP